MNIFFTKLRLLVHDPIDQKLEETIKKQLYWLIEKNTKKIHTIFVSNALFLLKKWAIVVL